MSKGHGRLNWANRQSPGEFDESAPTEIDYSFDYTRSTIPGTPSWPEKHSGQKFGPSFIKACWKKGLIVVAEVEGFPRPIAIQEMRWGPHGVLEVKTLEGFRIAERLFTRTSAKGLSSCGELLREE